MELPVPLFHWKFQEVYLMKVKISKPLLFSIIFTFIDDFKLNSDNNEEIWGYGACWPSLAFLAFVGLDNFLKQKLAFADTN